MLPLPPTASSAPRPPAAPPAPLSPPSPASAPSPQDLPPAQRMTPQEMMLLLDRVPLAEGMSVPALWEARFSAAEVAGLDPKAAAHLAVVNPLVQQMLIAPPAPRPEARASAQGIRDTAADLAACQGRLAAHLSALATPWPAPDLELVSPSAMASAARRLGTVRQQSWAALAALGEAAGDHAVGAHAILADAFEHAELAGAASPRAVLDPPCGAEGWQPRVWSLRIAVGDQLLQWTAMWDALPPGVERLDWLKIVQPRARELEWLVGALGRLGDRIAARRREPGP